MNPVRMFIGLYGLYRADGYSRMKSLKESWKGIEMTFSDRKLPIGVEPSKPECAHCCDTGWLNPESKTDLTPCPHCDPDNQPAEESAGDGYSQRDYEMDCAQDHYEEMKAGNANYYRIYGR